MPGRPDLWQARLQIDGTRHTAYGIDEPNALGRLLEILEELDAGIQDPAAARKVTLKQWAERYLGSAVLKPRARRRYAIALRRHVLPELGHRRLSEITPEYIGAALLRMEDRGISAASRRYALTTLSTVLSAAVASGLMARNPAFGMRRPAVVRQTFTPPTDEELERVLLVAYARQDPRRTLWRVAIETGARQSELVGLRWADIRGGIWYVDTSITYGTDKRDTPKGGRSHEIPLTPAAIEALEERRLEQLRDGTGSPEGFVWTTRTGRPLNGKHVWAEWSRALRRANVPHASFHVGTRHAIVTRSLEAGADLLAVSRAVGHANVSTTEGYARTARTGSTVGLGWRPPAGL